MIPNAHPSKCRDSPPSTAVSRILPPCIVRQSAVGCVCFCDATARHLRRGKVQTSKYAFLRCWKPRHTLIIPAAKANAVSASAGHGISSGEIRSRRENAWHKTRETKESPKITGGQFWPGP